jgi:hypothetical protein
MFLFSELNSGQVLFYQKIALMHHLGASATFLLHGGGGAGWL